MEAPNETSTNTCETDNIVLTTNHPKCVLCGREVFKSTERRRLLKDNQKTVFLLQLEEVLAVSVDVKDCSILCKYCSGRVKTVIAKTKKIRADFATCERNMKEKYRNAGKTRIPGSPTKDNKLFTSLDNGVGLMTLVLEKENNSLKLWVSESEDILASIPVCSTV